MMTENDRNSKYPKRLYAVVILTTIVAITAITVAGSLWRYETVEGRSAAVTPMAVESVHEHEITEDSGPSDVAHLEDGVLNGEEPESDELFEITLNAIEGLSWGFEPSIVEVPVGHRVKLTLVNDGMVEHDVEILGIAADEFDIVDGVGDHPRLGGGHHEGGVVAAHAAPGTTATVFFNATETGIFKFACTIPGHEEAGMVGRLVVTG